MREKEGITRKIKESVREARHRGWKQAKVYIASEVDKRTVRKWRSDARSFVSPGKTKYNTRRKVSKRLTARNLDCFHNKSTTEEEEDTEGSDFNPSDDEKKPEPSCKRIGVAVERRFFFCKSTQLLDLVEQINSTSRCSTPDCNG